MTFLPFLHVRRPLIWSRLRFNAALAARNATSWSLGVMGHNYVSRKQSQRMAPLKRNSHHDVGGKVINTEEQIMNFQDTPLLAWEQQCHALFVVLATQGILGTDALRRAIEYLTPEQYESWAYYEKWTAAMVNLLLEKTHHHRNRDSICSLR